MDESGFQLSPKTYLLIGEQGKNTYEESARSNKERITALFAINASGTFALNSINNAGPSGGHWEKRKWLDDSRVFFIY